MLSNVILSKFLHYLNGNVSFCDKSGATWVLALDISKAFDKVWRTGLIHKSNGISGPVFSIILSFLSNRQLRVVLNGKSSWEYSVHAGVLQGSILQALTLFLISIIIIKNESRCLGRSKNGLCWKIELEYDHDGMTYVTLQTGTGNAVLISMPKKLSLFPLTGRATALLLMWQ